MLVLVSLQTCTSVLFVFNLRLHIIPGVATILGKIFGTKERNPVKLDRKRKV